MSYKSLPKPSKEAKQMAIQLLILSKLRGAEHIVADEIRKVMQITREDLLEYPLFSELILEGEEIAEKRGQQAAMESLLSKQLRQRFGALPAWAKKKIKAADVKTLEKWALQVLIAESLEGALK